MSLIKTENRSGPRTEPWGTPVSILKVSPRAPSIQTEPNRSFKKAEIHFFIIEHVP